MLGAQSSGATMRGGPLGSSNDSDSVISSIKSPSLTCTVSCAPSGRCSPSAKPLTKDTTPLFALIAKIDGLAELKDHVSVSPSGSSAVRRSITTVPCPAVSATSAGDQSAGTIIRGGPLSSSKPSVRVRLSLAMPSLTCTVTCALSGRVTPPLDELKPRDSDNTPLEASISKTGGLAALNDHVSASPSGSIADKISIKTAP